MGIEPDDDRLCRPMPCHLATRPHSRVCGTFYYLSTRVRATIIAVQKLTDRNAVNVQVKRKVIGNPQ